MKFLRILAIIVVAAFALLLLVGFDNILELLRSRVALFLVLVPLVGLFLWSICKAVQSRREPRGYIEVPPRKP